MERPAVRADILGKLLLVQQTLDVLPDNGGIAAFLRRALGEIPGVIDVHLCVEGEVFPPSDEFTEACARYEASWSASGIGTERPVGSASTLWVPLRTARRLHGALILSLGVEEAFSPYRDFIRNIANVVATTLETRQYIRQLDEARAGLEDQVAQRTARLGESQERFRGLFENTPVPIWEEDFSEAWAHLERLPRDEIDDIDAYLREHPGIVHRCAELVRIIDLNEAAVRLHQAAGKDELLAGLTRTFTPESFETLRQELVAMWNGGTRLQADAVVRTLAGAPRSVTISWAVSPGHEERFGRVIVAEVDITERRLAEEALRESENKFRQVSASAQDAVIVLDQDGRITDWNAAAERIFGYPASEAIGQSLHTLVVPARHGAASRRGLRRFRKTGTGPMIGQTLERVARRPDGAEFPVELSISSVLLRGEWHAIGMVRDITERKRAEEKLRASEAELREAQRIAHVGSWWLDIRGNALEWSDESYRIFGIEIGRPLDYEGFLDRAHPDDRAAVDRAWKAALRGAPYGIEHRIVVDRETKWVREQAELTFDAAGRAIEGIGTVQDITERRFAQEELRASEERFREFLSRVRAVAVILDPDGRMRFANDYFLKLTGWGWEEVAGQDFFETFVPPAERDARRAGVLSLQLAAAEPRSFVTRDGDIRILEFSGVALTGRAGEVIGIAGLGQDITDRLRAEEERDRLAAAIQQAPDPVAITDTSGTLVYANPAALALIDQPSGRILGRRITDTVPQLVPQGWDDVSARVLAGETLRGDWASRRPDGSTMRIEGSVSPVRDPSGRISHLSFVGRDVTHEREVEEELATGLRIRAAVAESLIGLRPGQGVPEIAQAICDNVATVPQLDVAILAHFLAEDSAIVTAVRAPPGFPLQAGQALPPGRSRILYRRAKRGPWATHWKARAEDAGYGRAISASGLKAVAYGPILYQGTPVGLLTIGTMHEEFARDIVTRAPALAEFSATSSALLAGPLDALRRRERERTGLQRIIAAGAFTPVFQPILDLATGEIVGYEALTRLADGCRPDRRFGSAWSVGLGIDLELATLGVAVAAAAGLPAGRWLDINVSPRLLQTPERLTEIVRRVDRPLVIEITEHDVIEDYPATRDAVRALGPNTRLAVDDAGAGIANFAHIIELRPDFVKLDIGLVRGVNTDLGRQALVIAMLHFSRTAGCRLVAEGVETEAEADTLAQLGVHFGQGYWFGRPQSVGAFASTHPGPPS